MIVFYAFFMMLNTFNNLPRIGLEPTCREAPEPKSGVSAIPPSGQRSNLEKVSSFRQLIFKWLLF
jgi:hypothetical protein